MRVYYKNMDMYQDSYRLAIELYKAVEKFPENTKGNIASQLRRAASSIPLNIAEGSVKKSQKEFLVFLNHAYGSAKELEVIMDMSKDLGFITVEQHTGYTQLLDSLMGRLFKYMEKIEAEFSERRRFYTTYHHTPSTRS